MRKIFVIPLFVLQLLAFDVVAQNKGTIVEPGQVLSIGSSKAYQYSTINFPQPNLIIKKGGIANYGKLAGTQVVVSEVSENDGEHIITLRRKDGKKFFGSFPAVKARYEKALASGELSL